MNLIRVMPAKGQDNSVATSLYLAKLIGPVALAIGIALLINRASFGALAHEFLASPALMFLSGIITMPAGLAIVLAHNVWAPDWRIIITVLGWLALIGGALRIIAPQRTAALGRRLIDHPMMPGISAAIYVVLGALLCYFGYARR